MNLIKTFGIIIGVILSQDLLGFSQKYSMSHLERLYNDTYETIANQSQKKLTFEESLKIYSYFVQNNEEIYALKLLESNLILNLIQKRFQILIQRPLSPDFNKKNEKNLLRLIASKNKIGELQKNNNIPINAIKAFEEELSRNSESISSEKIVKLHRLISEVAKKPTKLTETELKKIILSIQNQPDFNPDLEEILLDDKSLVLQKKGSTDEEIPLNAFAPGLPKADYLIELLRFINENPNNLNPVAMSGYVLQTVVSLNPLEKNSALLGKILADYVLIKNGFLPLIFNESDQKKYSRIAVFPLNEFNQQIAPDDVIELILRGLNHSYDIFEEILSDRES